MPAPPQMPLIPPLAMPQASAPAPAVTPSPATMDPIAVSIFQRLEAVERENVALKAQVSQQQQLAAAQQTTVEPPAVVTLPREAPMVDTKLLGRPMNGVKDEAHWPVFSRMIKGYLAAMDSKFPALLERCADQALGVSNLELKPEEVRLSQQLYYVLLMLLVEGRAAEKPDLVATGEGAVLWRLVLAEYEPNVKARATCLHQQVLGFALGTDVATSMDQFDKPVIAHKKASGKIVDDDTIGWSLAQCDV